MIYLLFVLAYVVTGVAVAWTVSWISPMGYLRIDEPQQVLMWTLAWPLSIVMLTCWELARYLTRIMP